MSSDAFTVMKRLLVPYARHFTVSQDTDDAYVLDEELRYARTMFGYAHRGRRGTRLVFYPLNAFPELRAGLPAVLADKIKSKYVMTFPEITRAETAALETLFEVAWKRIAAQRALAPSQAYYRKLDLDATQAVVADLVDRTRLEVTVTRRTRDVELKLPARAKVPAVLAPRVAKPGVLRLKTITPAERDALAGLLRA